MTTALTTTENKPPLAIAPLEFSAFGNITHFENAQRMAKALASSSMVPETYRGDQNLGSCIIALEMANRIGANVLSVMQNLYIVHGKPAWSSQFLISCANASGKFTPLRYRMTGTPGQDSYGCVAWAQDKSGEKLESPEVTVAMAKAEGWFQKNGSKWKTMPELMLRYRSATLFVRLYAPELTMGLHCDDEVVDIVEVAPVVTDMPNFNPAPAKKDDAKAKNKAKEKVIDVSAEPPKPPAAAPENPHLAALEVAMDKQGVYNKQVLDFYNEAKNGIRGNNPEADKLDKLPETVMVALSKALNEGNAQIIEALKKIDPV